MKTGPVTGQRVRITAPWSVLCGQVGRVVGHKLSGNRVHHRVQVTHLASGWYAAADLAPVTS